MNPASLPAIEIKRLHCVAEQEIAASRQALQNALSSAWQAGRLLNEEQARVRRKMGASAWLLWLETNFSATHRTALHYMRLGRSGVVVEAELQELSLRQSYLRLGIAIEPASRARSPRLPGLPPHIRFAQRLLTALPPRRRLQKLTPEKLTNYRQDLRAIYEQLRSLYESTDTSA